MPAPDVNGFDPGPALVCKTCGYWFCTEPCPDAKPTGFEGATLAQRTDPLHLPAEWVGEIKPEDLL